MLSAAEKMKEKKIIFNCRTRLFPSLVPPSFDATIKIIIIPNAINMINYSATEKSKIRAEKKCEQNTNKVHKHTTDWKQNASATAAASAASDQCTCKMYAHNVVIVSFLYSKTQRSTAKKWFNANEFHSINDTSKHSRTESISAWILHNIETFKFVMNRTRRT